MHCIESEIFIGGEDDLADLSILDKAGIKHILNVADEVAHSDELQGRFECVKVPLFEDAARNALSQLWLAVKTLSRYADRQETILVHSKHGRLRAPTIVAMHLARVKGIRFDESYRHLLKEVPGISPTSELFDRCMRT